MIKAILFDGDDTLYRTKEFVKALDMKVMGRLSKKANVSAEKLYEEWREITYSLSKSRSTKLRYREHFYTVIFRRYKVRDAAGLGLKEYNWFSSAVIKKIKPVPGAKSALKKLRKKYKLAVFTGDRGERARKKLKKVGLDKFFRVIISSREVGTVKPNRKYYTLAAKKLGVKPKECLVVGNNFKDDIEPAQQMGIKAVMFGYNDDSDECLSDYRQLLVFINKIGSAGSN